MSEINEKKWEEALEKIDEKYIDKAIEEMASHSEESKIAAEKSFNKGIRIAKIAGGIAASVAVIAGVGVIMNANGITISELWEMRPSEVTTTTTTIPNISETTTTPATDNTTTPPVSDTEETDVPNDTPETILMGKSFITQNGYEYSFSYEYTQTGGETRGIMSKLRMEVFDHKTTHETIYNDYITDLDIIGDNIEIYNEENTYNCVELQVFEMSDYNLVHINIPHRIEGQNYGADNQSVFLVLTENDDGTYSFKDIKAPDGSDFECYPYSVYKLKDEDVIIIYDSYPSKNAYKVDIENLKFTECQISDFDNDEANIVDIMADLEPLSAEEEFSIYENYFYGKWESAYTGISDRYANSEMEDRDFSYYGDTSTESWSSYERGFYEDETGWYMTGLNGGIGNAHFIPKNDPDTMYFYQEMPCQKNQYYCIFKRSENEAEYDTAINAGSLNSIGLRKLQHITGCDLSVTAAEDGILKLDDGSEWTTSTNLYYGTGKTYLNEISESRIRISQRYFTTDEALYDPLSDTNVPYPEMQYVTFTIDKLDGQWKVTATDRYDRCLETCEGMPTVYTEMYLAEAERTRNENDVPDLKAVTSVEYFTDSTGHYYAFRRIGINHALNLKAGELYYFNGVEYELMQTFDNYAEVTFLNDIIYVSHYNEEYDERHLSYFSKTSIMGLDGNGFVRKGAGRANFVTMKNCIVYTHETADETVRYIINGDRQNPIFTEIKNIEYSDGSSGFRAETEDGKKITYSDYSSAKLSDQLWLLNSRMESIYNILWGGNIRVDMENSISVRYEKYGYVDNYNLHNYFLETAGSDLAYDLLYNAPARLYLYNGKYYAPEMTGYTPKYSTAYEIISENQDTAKVKYTVYMRSDPYGIGYFTGPYTYTAELVRTEYGWRFESIKNDGVDSPLSVGGMENRIVTGIVHYRIYANTPEAKTVDMNDSITVDGNTYYYLDTYEGFKEYESGFFSEKAVDEILLKLDTIKVSDGKVYIRHEPSEKTINYTYNFTMEKADSDSIELSVTFWTEENKISGAVAEGIPFTVIYENEKWVLDSFSFPE